MQIAPAGSPYDLHFSVGPFPTRVAWTFWLAAILLGWNSIHTEGGGQPQPIYLLLWVVILFVSILVHELGHAIAARSFGYPAHILLYHFGGLAYYQPNRHTSGREILISLAGPAAGLALYRVTWLVVVYGLPNLPSPDSDRGATIARYVIRQMIWVNFFWSFVNLLPVLPLDGGHVCQSVCMELNPNSGNVWALRIGTVAGGAAAIYFFQSVGSYAGILFLILAVQNYLALQGRSL